MGGSVGNFEENNRFNILSNLIEPLQVMMGGRSDGVAFEEEEDDAEHGVDETEEFSKVKKARHENSPKTIWPPSEKCYYYFRHLFS